uniref:Uncharacterized protein n=1 Tax=Arundo donax TaxID=35708 RepID=A0A0A9HFH8_ARUDO
MITLVTGGPCSSFQCSFTIWFGTCATPNFCLPSLQKSKGT